MRDRKKKFYFDIISSIDLIEQFTIGVDLFSQYKLDKKTKSAVERQFLLLAKLLKE